MFLKFPYLGETKEINDTTRANAPGDFVQLSDGVTHYDLSGPQRIQKVIFVHGFSVPYFIWDPTFKFLTKSGFHALRYDLFGRGLSDRPMLRYNIDLFCKQLRELADKLDFEKFTLIGLSMGGVISATFTMRFPERVNKLILFDPAGARPVTLSRLLKAATTPGFGELALGLFGSGQMVKGIRSDFHDPVHFKDFVAKYMVQLKYKGFMRAILSTMRNGMLGNFVNTYKAIGMLGTPVALFWGINDKTVPFEHSNDIRAAIPQTLFHPIKDSSHLPHYEKPEVVNPLLLEFLQ